MGWGEGDGVGGGVGEAAGAAPPDSANYTEVAQHHFNEDVKECTLGSSSVVFMRLLSRHSVQKMKMKIWKQKMAFSQACPATTLPTQPRREGRREA